MRVINVVILICLGIKMFGQVVDIPDPNFLAAIIDDGVDTNQDGLIQVSEAELVEDLNVQYYGNSPFDRIQDLTGISAFANLVKLNTSTNDLLTIDLSNNIHLEHLNCFQNDLNSINISNNNKLKYLNCEGNNLEEIVLENLDSLEYLIIGKNDFVELSIDKLINLKYIDITSSQELDSLFTSNNLKLEEIISRSNSSAYIVSLGMNQPAVTLDLRQNINLRRLDVEGSRLDTMFDISNNLNLSYLNCFRNDFESIDISKNIALDTFLWSIHNNVQDIEPALLNLDNKTELLYLDVGDLADIDISNCRKIESVYFSGADITFIDLSSNSKIVNFNCYSTNIKSLGFGNCPDLKSLGISTTVEALDLNNGTSIDELNVSNLSNLSYICADNSSVLYNEVLNVTEVDRILDELGSLQDVYIDTDCNFQTLDVKYPKVLSGTVKFGDDLACLNNSHLVDKVKLSFIDLIDDENFNIISFQGMNGYSYRMPNTNLIPEYNGEFPEAFNVSLSHDTLNFIENDTIDLNICISPTETSISDISIDILSFNSPRAGENSNYIVKLENNGNTQNTISINLELANDTVSLQNASLPFSQNQNLFTFNDILIEPLSTRNIEFQLRYNSPMETPALQGGELIKTTVTIINQDEDLENNYDEVNEVVVNSFDPNDKICLQGEWILLDQLGDYLTYRIRFENTGNGIARNVIIKDDLNGTDLLASSLDIIASSHGLQCTNKDGNVAFYFENINLPFEDEANDGFVVFKIRSKSFISDNSSIENLAEIFFDFNYPIVTNTSVVSIAIDMDNDGYLSNVDCDDNNPEIYPNALEICNGIDDNCDGQIDNGLNYITYFVDADMDGYGNSDNFTEDCNQPTGTSTVSGDCDDSNPNINPSAEDIANNGIDEDCDGMDLVSSIYEIGNAEINIYPNPTIDEINFEIEGQFKFQVSLYDLNGKLIVTKSNTNQLKLESTPNGTYLVEIIDQNTGVKIVKKIFIMR